MDTQIKLLLSLSTFLCVGCSEKYLVYCSKPILAINSNCFCLFFILLRVLWFLWLVLWFDIWGGCFGSTLRSIERYSF